MVEEEVIMELKTELKEAQCKEKAIRKELDKLVNESKAHREDHNKQRKTNETELNNLVSAQDSLKEEERRLNARNEAITDLEPTCNEEADEDSAISALHREVLGNKVRLIEIQSEKNKLALKYASQDTSVRTLKQPTNEALETIENKVSILKEELAANLERQEKLKRVIDPKYNMKTSFEKAADDENSNTSLIVSLVIAVCFIPIFGPIAIVAALFIGYKLYRKASKAKQISDVGKRV